jgi:hypothetical protein
MSSFFIGRRKTFELSFMLLIDGLFYWVTGYFEFVILFTFGYVWNWVGSQREQLSVEARNYRYSTLKTVLNLQQLVGKPFTRAPYVFQMLARSLPAGLFWWGVVVFNESQMPWWAVFIGSFTMELVQLENKLFHSSSPSEPPV